MVDGPKAEILSANPPKGDSNPSNSSAGATLGFSLQNWNLTRIANSGDQIRKKMPSLDDYSSLLKRIKLRKQRQKAPVFAPT